MNTKTRKTIPIFYACDDNFIKFAAISIKSILENSDKNRFYSFHILITDLSPQNRKAVLLVKQSNILKSLPKIFPYAIIIPRPPITDCLLPICSRSWKR